ncbi:MAG: hypothetical protein NZ750_12720 [Anaerolineae bacterium]|nr:hypothetical protein [Anaerolineae bacterium]MDW8173638.1 hypothetical protein [Anaerolineae bacterium]
MKTRQYLVVALVTGSIFYVLGLLGGPGLRSFILQFEAAAVRGGVSQGLVDLITEPMIQALSGSILASAIAGLLWPVTLLWVVLLFVLIVFAILGPGLNTAADTFRS